MHADNTDSRMPRLVFTLGEGFLTLPSLPPAIVTATESARTGLFHQGFPVPQVREYSTKREH